MASMATTVIATRAAYKMMKKQKKNKTKHSWITEFEMVSRELDFVTEDGDDETISPKERSRNQTMALFETRDEDWYVRLAFFVNCRITRKSWFENFITGCILLVGLATGIDVTYVHNATVPQWALMFTEITSKATLAVFTLEAALKIVAFGRQPQRYFTDEFEGGYNSFDFLIIALSYGFLPTGEGGAILVMRLMRLVRVMNLFEQLRVILRGLAVGLRSVSSILMLLTLIVFMFAVLGVTAFGANDPAHFATVPLAMVTLFRCATLASWKNVYEINYFGCDAFDGGLYEPPPSAPANATMASAVDEGGEAEGLPVGLATFVAGGSTWPDWVCAQPQAQPLAAAIFFFVYTLITALVIMSLFIGVITMGMFEARRPARRGVPISPFNASFDSSH